MPSCYVSSAFLPPALRPLPSVLVSCCSLSLRVSSRRLLTVSPFRPLHGPPKTSLFLYSQPFALLLHQSSMLCLLACVEPHFSLLLTHKSIYRKIQREAMSGSVSGRPQIEIIIVAYGNLIEALKKTPQTGYPT